jgi:hypothetical protein
MAEIEPISGGAGQPGEPGPVATEPVAGAAAGPPTAPLAPGATTAPGAPAARPGGLARWGVALLAVAVMVGVVSVGAALLAAGSGASAVRGWLPNDTLVYLEIRADLPGDQRAKVGDILAKFPGFADQASLDAKIDEALDRVLEGSGVSWTNDVKPWLGGEVGFAVTSAALDPDKLGGLGSPLDGPDLGDAPDDGALALIAVKDAAAATAWVSKELEGTQTTETYAGGEITIVSGLMSTNVAFAVRDDVLLLGPEETVKASLDTGGSSTFSSSDSFEAAEKTAPTAYLVYGYVDMKALVEAALEVAGDAAADEAGLPAACLDDAADMIPDWAAGSARAEDDALVFAGTAAQGGPVTTGEDSASAIAAHLPGSTVVAIEVRDLGAGLVAGLESLTTTLACDPSTAEMVGQLEEALVALGGAETLIGWADDTAIAVAADGTALGGGLAAIVTDEAAASVTLDQVRALLALAGGTAGITSREEPYGDGTLLVITVPSDVVAFDAPAPEIAITVQGGIFAAGTIDFVKSVVDTETSGSLAKDPVYERAIDLAGGDGMSDVFVDIAGLRVALEAMIPADEKSEYETDIQPFLVPLEAFATVVEAPGETTESRAVLTFTK